MVKASASRVAGTGFDSHFLHGDLDGSSHTSDLKMALGWLLCQAPAVIGSALGLIDLVSVYVTGEVESLICNFCLSVAACKVV